MVNAEDLYPGCKVRIVDKWVPGCRENSGGEMDCWLGKVMTVGKIYIVGREVSYVKMEEDGQKGRHWFWYLPAIAEIITEDFPDVEDLI